MASEIPKFHETFIPILNILAQGETISNREMKKLVINKHYSSLPADLMQVKIKNGTPLIESRIGWGKTYLKQAKLLTQPSRGMVKITEKGKAILNKGSLTLRELKSDSEYIAAEQAKQKSKTKEETKSFENSTPQDLIEIGFSEIEKDIKSELLDKFKQIDPYYFEKTILLLLNKMGYGSFIETKKSNDGGIDGIINQDQLGLKKYIFKLKGMQKIK